MRTVPLEITELRAASEEQLRKDMEADPSPVASVNNTLRLLELDRRRNERREERLFCLTKIVTILTVATTILTAINVAAFLYDVHLRTSTAAQAVAPHSAPTSAPHR